MQANESVYLHVRLSRQTRNHFASEAKRLGLSQGQFIELLLARQKQESLSKPEKRNIFRI